MVYRADITYIKLWAELNHDTEENHIVRDQLKVRNVYMEVDSEEEANLLEAINLAQRLVGELKREWQKKYQTKDYYVE